MATSNTPLSANSTTSNASARSIPFSEGVATVRPRRFVPSCLRGPGEGVPMTPVPVIAEGAGDHGGAAGSHRGAASVEISKLGSLARHVGARSSRVEAGRDTLAGAFSGELLPEKMQMAERMPKRRTARLVEVLTVDEDHHASARVSRERCDARVHRAPPPQKSPGHPKGSRGPSTWRCSTAPLRLGRSGNNASVIVRHVSARCPINPGGCALPAHCPLATRQGNAWERSQRDLSHCVAGD
jgi:hypothetical protein